MGLTKAELAERKAKREEAEREQDRKDYAEFLSIYKSKLLLLSLSEYFDVELVGTEDYKISSFSEDFWLDPFILTASDFRATNFRGTDSKLDQCLVYIDECKERDRLFEERRAAREAAYEQVREFVNANLPQDLAEDVMLALRSNLL